MNPTTTAAAFSFLSCILPLLPAQSAAQAAMFYKHRLVEDAKRTAIQTLFADRSASAQVQCKALLARIACDEHRIGDAMELWQDIARNHPDTDDGKVAAELVQQWSTLSREEVIAPAEPATAAWFSAARFWLGDLPRTPPIDTRWLDTAEAATFWLRKVIDTFPKSPAAAEALAEIVRAHLGAEATADRPGRGALGCAADVRTNPRSQHRPVFETSIAKAELALHELKKEFPASAELPRLQFTIAHAYWLQGDEERSRPWLIKVADEAPVDTFWAHLARLRLKNWRS